LFHYIKFILQKNNEINIMKYKSILKYTQQKIENNLELFNNELKINKQKKKAFFINYFIIIIKKE